MFTLLIEFARTPGAKDLKPRKTRTLYSHLRKGAITGSQIGAAKGVVEGLGNTSNLKGKQKLLGIAGNIAGSTWKNSLRGLHIGTASGGATYIGRRSIDKLRGNDKYKYKIKGKGDNFLFRPRLNRSAYM